MQDLIQYDKKSKSHFAYFHDDTAPLMRSQREALAEHNVHFHDSWVPVLGAVVGKDDAAIIDGLTVTFGDDEGRSAFFRRAQSDALHFNTAMLLLRHCGVPQLNYLLRCMPPTCIAQQAAVFDDQLLRAAAARLDGHYDQYSATTIYYMQAKLQHGGEGLTSAVRTSPAAYLGSLAAVATAPEFAPYTVADCPLESDLLVLGWIEQSMQQVVEATPLLAAALPTQASTFFHHITTTRSSSSISTSLQRQLNSQADLHSHKAFLSRCWEMRKVDGGAMLAHAKAVSAPRAWAWKNVIPMTQDTDMCDEHYRIAARMNVRLPPIDGMDALPHDCPLCNKRNAIRDDQWHFLTCNKVKSLEVSARHDEVVNVLYRSALLMGIQAVREPAGLHSGDGRCPDLQLVLPGRNIISDVCIPHPLAPSGVKSRRSWATTGAARNVQNVKHKRYKETAAQHHAELLPFCVETYGGMAPDAIKLLSVMGAMGEEQLGMWPRHVVIRHLMGSVATAVQRGNAVAWLSGYSRALAAMAQTKATEGSLEEQEWAAEEREYEATAE
jgi:hypothetical protein